MFDLNVWRPQKTMFDLMDAPFWHLTRVTTGEDEALNINVVVSFTGMALIPRV